MIGPLLFATATLAGGQPIPPPALAVVARPHLVKPTAWKKKIGVTVVLPSGAKVTTGPAEATTITRPQPVDYDLLNCLQLQAAQPWHHWTCP